VTEDKGARGIFPQPINELKAVDTLMPVYRAQLLNYPKASRLPVGLLLNFGSPRLEVKRVLL
jgi:GxxExxY protein